MFPQALGDPSLQRKPCWLDTVLCPLLLQGRMGGCLCGGRWAVGMVLSPVVSTVSAAPELGH
jgi:hypothetical protein